MVLRFSSAIFLAVCSSFTARFTMNKGKSWFPAKDCIGSFFNQCDVSGPLSLAGLSPITVTPSYTFSQSFMETLMIFLPYVTGCFVFGLYFLNISWSLILQ